MHCRGVLLLLIVLSGCGAESTPVTSQPDSFDTTDVDVMPLVGDTGIEGRWRIVSLLKNGQEAIDSSGVPIEIEFVNGRQFMTQGGMLLDDSGYVIDPGTTPNSIDIIHNAGGGKTATTQGIYEVNGDETRLCMGSQQSRPKEFASTSEYNVTVLKRITSK